MKKLLLILATAASAPIIAHAELESDAQSLQAYLCYKKGGPTTVDYLPLDYERPLDTRPAPALSNLPPNEEEQALDRTDKSQAAFNLALRYARAVHTLEPDLKAEDWEQWIAETAARFNNWRAPMSIGGWDRKGLVLSGVDEWRSDDCSCLSIATESGQIPDRYWQLLSLEQRARIVVDLTLIVRRESLFGGNSKRLERFDFSRTRHIESRKQCLNLAVKHGDAKLAAVFGFNLSAATGALAGATASH